MLLENLYKIVKMGAEKPLFLWLDVLESMRHVIILELEEAIPQLDEGTEIRTNVKRLIALLKQDTPNELDLAKILSYIASLFRGETSGEHRELVNDYTQAVTKFYSNAQLSELHHQAREKLKSSLPGKAQREHDLFLFQHEGMTYCLEYYLEMYKRIKEAPNNNGKRKYIESTEVKLGFGNVSGLWIDFSRDEVLGKFIYSILDDDARKRLTKDYFDAKLVLMKIKIQCDKTGVCDAVYQGVTLEEVMEAFRHLIQALLEAFQEMGIDRLASVFFKPYGDKPLIKDINL